MWVSGGGGGGGEGLYTKLWKASVGPLVDIPKQGEGMCYAS